MFDFLKKNKGVQITTPVEGKIIPITEVNDATFAQKLMGEGVAIVPTSNKVVSPVEGEIVLVAPTKHAFGIKTKEGIEILVHVGLDTVKLNGEGFIQHKQPGDHVKAHELILEFDREDVEKKGIDSTVIVVFLNLADHKFDDIKLNGDATSTKTVICNFKK